MKVQESAIKKET